MKSCPICGEQYPDDAVVCKEDGATLPEAAEKKDPFLEKVIKGKYKVIKQLGVGGMGAVYLGEQVGLGRKVALKVLHSDFARDEEFVKRFRHEARLAATISHPNVVITYDFDQTDDGSLFIAMEYVEGRDLRDVMHDGIMDIGQALRLGVQIGDALGAVHKAGVIDRDVKPENIRVVKGRDEVKLMDFGIARATDTGASTRLTKAGMIMGTPAYMAPEQIEGGEVTERTDIYAYGIVIYEMLSGNVPFKASSPTAVLMKHLKDAPIPVKQLRDEIPAAVAKVVMQAIEKDPQKRPKSMGEMVESLKRAGGIGVDTGATLSMEALVPPKPWYQDYKMISAAVVVVLALGAGGYMALSTPDADEATKMAQEKAKTAQVETLLVQAKNFRDQGDYKQAYATLKKAKDLDPNDDKLKAEVNATDKSCNAEKGLGLLQKDVVCSM